MTAPAIRSSNAARLGLLAVLFVAAPAGHAFAQLSVGMGARGGASAPAAMPAQTAVAYAFAVQEPIGSIDIGSVLPDLQDAVADLKRLDYADPDQAVYLTPIIARLADSGISPAALTAMDAGVREKLLVETVSEVAAEKRGQAAVLIFGTGKGRIADDRLDSVEEEVGAVQEASIYLTPKQKDAVSHIGRQVFEQRAEARRVRIMGGARKIADHLGMPVESDATPANGTPEVLIRKAIAPDGREGRLVRQGRIYRFYYEGDSEPVVEYDISRLEEDGIPAYNVERDGRKGIHLNGQVLWEDGIYEEG